MGFFDLAGTDIRREVGLGRLLKPDFLFMIPDDLCRPYGRGFYWDS